MEGAKFNEIVEGQVIAHQRLVSLIKFYGSGQASKDQLIEEDVKSAGSVTEEALGQWATEQFLKAAKTLHVEEFILPLEHGGVMMPEVAGLQEYVDAFLKLKEEAIDEMAQAQKFRKRNLLLTKAGLVEAEEVVDAAEDNAAAEEAQLQELLSMMVVEDTGGGETAEEAMQGSMETSQSILKPTTRSAGKKREDSVEKAKSARDAALRTLASARKSYEQRYSTWSTEQAALQKEVMTLEDWRNDARKHGNAQCLADTDALLRASNALVMLKKVLSGLMDKVPVISAVVRRFGADNLDPFEESDMRSCYANLLDRFRKNDQLGVATSIMVGIRVAQGNGELEDYMRTVESFYQKLVKMKVTTVSIGDLAAMIAISGMNVGHRKKFLESEKQLALTLDSIGELEDGAGDDGEGSIIRRSKKSLYDKVRSYCASEVEAKILLSKFSGQGVDGRAGALAQPDGTTGDAKTALKRMREAELAYATMVKQEDKNACFDFAAGKCSRGDSCRFTHASRGRAQPEPVAAGSSAAPAGEKPVCRQFLAQGTCRFGTTCKFAHVAANTQQAAPAGSAAPPGKSGQKASSVIFAVDAAEWGDGDGDHQVSNYCVHVRDVAVEEHDVQPKVDAIETVCAAPVRAPPKPLGWDTYASCHVAQDRDVIPDAKPLGVMKEAVGVGGARRITHAGMSPVYKMPMVYIEGGGTPSLMSVGKYTQADASGLQGAAIFTAHGAVRFRVTPQIASMLAQIVDVAEEQGLLQGTAVQRGYVYQEDFDGGARAAASPAARSNTEDCWTVHTSLYANRIKMDSMDGVIDLLVASGMNKATLLAGAAGVVKGFPPGVTKEKVENYFRYIGKRADQMEAEITTARLRRPRDYVEETTNVPGVMVQIDNVDPSFSRVSQSVEGKAKQLKRVVPSIGGFRDVVIAVDEATGFVVLMGRASKANPHVLVEQVIAVWKKVGPLEMIKADQEFVTKESIALVQKAGCKFRQAVPGDHARGPTTMVEGAARWLQELAQGNMNRLRPLVKDNVITAEQAATLWFDAFRQAVIVSNFRPSLRDPTKSRYEEFNGGERANISNVILLPFGMRVIARSLINDGEGRGAECIFVGSQLRVRGGMITYNLTTKRLAIKYSFLSINNVRTPTPAQVQHATRTLYGRLKELTAPEREVAEGRVVVIPDSAHTAEVAQLESPAAAQAGCTSSASQGSATEGVDSAASGDSSQRVASSAIESGGGIAVAGESRSITPAVVSRYGTRSKSREVVAEVLVEESKLDRPAKPVVPPPRQRLGDQAWIDARNREAQKLLDEDTVTPLPIDARGKSVFPPDAIVLSLLEIAEYKWKPDPVTGVERWLECVRLVCDGSVDKRVENCYAETPDRTLLFLMTSIEATLGIKSTTSDVTRAYLNAPSLDRNIVIRAPPGLKGFPTLSLMNKGLYGSKKGALSWQVWVDDKFMALGYRKLDIARGVYLKDTGRMPVLALRHSDDIRMSCADESLREEEERQLKELVRMAEFSPTGRFLGCTHEYVKTPQGWICLVRQEDKIREMQEKFSHLHDVYNPRNFKRRMPLPLCAIQDEDLLSEEQRTRLDDKQYGVYQALVGCIMWIANSVRPEVKLGMYLLSTRMSTPRQWDMYLAVWVMDYMVDTIDAPLVLGGAKVDPVVYCDASFALLPERKSIVAHVAMTACGSGAIYANVGSTHCAVTSIWEAELVAGCAGIDTALYITKACQELGFALPACRTVYVDNQAEVQWIQGSVSNKRSRHVDVRFYRVRHLQSNGDVNVVHVATKDNIADILTKPLPAAEFRRLAGRILGHALCVGVLVRGLLGEFAGANKNGQDGN